MKAYALFVHDDPGFGGVAHVAAQLAEGLRGQGWEVEHWNARLAPGDALKFAARLRKRHGIAVATQNFSAAYACAALAVLARRPWVMWVHGPVVDVLCMAGAGAAKSALLRWFYRRARYVVCASETARGSLLEFCGFERPRVDVIRNTAAAPFFGVTRERRPAGHEIGFVGRLSPEKQPLLALDVLRALPREYRLHMVGDGPLRAQLGEAGANEIAAGRLMLAGAQSISADTYRRWDATLLCSVYEGFPLAPLESLASGVPVVSSPIPAAAELLAGHAPYMLARDGTAAAIARSVQELLARDAAQVQRDIAQINQEHDPSAFVRHWDELLSQRLGR